MIRAVSTDCLLFLTIIKSKHCKSGTVCSQILLDSFPVVEYWECFWFLSTIKVCCREQLFRICWLPCIQIWWSHWCIWGRWTFETDLIIQSTGAFFRGCVWLKTVERLGDGEQSWISPVTVLSGCWELPIIIVSIQGKKRKKKKTPKTRFTSSTTFLWTVLNKSPSPLELERALGSLECPQYPVLTSHRIYYLLFILIMLHCLYDSKPLNTSMGGVIAWHPQNSLSACWMEKTSSKGVCGKKGDMKEWKRTSRRNCVQSPSLEEKLNLTRWRRGDIWQKWFTPLIHALL